MQLIASIVATKEFRQLLALPLLAWQQLLVIVLAWGVIATGIFLYIDGVLPFWLVLLSSVLARYALFTPFHDATHCAVSRSPLINDALGTIAGQGLFPGVSTHFYRFLHLEHHRYTGNKHQDPDDILVSGAPWQRAVNMLFFDVRLLYWWWQHRDLRSGTGLLADYVCFALFVAWHILWLSSPFAIEFMLLWMLPQRLGILMTAYLFAGIQHPEGVEQQMHPIQGTRMFDTGILGRWFMLSQSQHLMHHLYPKLPYYRYNKAWLLSKQKLESRGVIWGKLFGSTKPMQLPEKQTGLRVKIERVLPLSERITAYTLCSLDGLPLPSYSPGAHIDVHIRPGLTRQYSITGLSRPGTYQIAVQREISGRGGSKALHESFKENTQVHIGIPRNLFPLQPGNGRVILVAGGIGITPLLSMAEHLWKQGRDFEFHVSCRSDGVLPFAQHLRGGNYQHVIRYHFSEQGTSLKEQDLPHWRTGEQLYLCGPAGFMERVKDMLSNKGWPNDTVHTEHFGTVTEKTGKDLAFKVKLAKSGTEIEVPAHKSLLQALQDNQVNMVASCEQGFCGTCECRVLEGEVLHRDVVLTEAQQQAGKMTSCVSRAKGGFLILDL